MSTLKVSFSRPKKFKPFAWLIMKVDDSDFSHASVSWQSDYLEREVVYQASSLLVNFCEGQRFAEEHYIVHELDITISEDTRKQVIQWAMDRAGIPYGILQCVGIGWVKFCRRFGKQVNNPFSNGTKTEVCCELVARLLQEELGYNIPENLDNLTPKDLWEILSKTPV